MTEASLRAIIKGLNDAGVRYLVVGGLAVNAHGYVRNTKDVDLLMELDTDNLVRGLRVLKTLGYQPKVPVGIEEFADTAKRESWIRDKGMVVFGLRSEMHRETDVDVFVNDPLGFATAYARAVPFPLEPDVMVPVCAYEDLVRLKLEAARPRDLDDLRRLRMSRGEEP